MTECIGFHMDSYYGTSRVFIFGVFSLLLQIIKQTDNWGEKKKRKSSQQLVSDLFGIAFKVAGIIQSCISECSKQLLSFETTLRWKKFTKYGMSRCYVKEFSHVEHWKKETKIFTTGCIVKPPEYKTQIKRNYE